MHIFHNDYIDLTDLRLTHRCLWKCTIPTQHKINKLVFHVLSGFSAPITSCSSSKGNNIIKRKSFKLVSCDWLKQMFFHRICPRMLRGLWFWFWDESWKATEGTDATKLSELLIIISKLKLKSYITLFRKNHTKLVIVPLSCQPNQH